MAYRTAIFFLMLIPMTSFAEIDSISPGDWLFVQARVIGCGEEIRDVEVGKVDQSGNVTFFREVSLKVVGEPLSKIASQITDAVERLTGHRPTTVKVIRIAEDNPKVAALNMLQIFRLRDSGCSHEVPPTETPEWMHNLHLIAKATYNKSFKYVPPASWLHRTQLRCAA